MLRPLAILLTLASPLLANVQPDLEAAITRGVNFLLAHQNKNGSWGGPTRTKRLNIYCPRPDGHQAFHAASTSLALHGLVEARDQRPATITAIKKGEAWLLENLPKTRTINPSATYNVWAHSYGLRALASLYRHNTNPAKRTEYKRQALIQIAKLRRYENVNYGWGYLDLKENTSKPSGKTFSFVTATALLAMHDAATTMDLPLPPTIVRRGIKSIQMQRNPDFTYAYSLEHRNAPRNRINRPAGSLARSQACNAALRIYGDNTITDTILTTWLQRLFDRQGWLSNGRKRPKPHEAPFGVSGYFYLYGHYYAAECIRLLPEKNRSPFKQKLAATLIALQETNGSWWDYPLYNYHYAYGTGYTLAALAHCR